MTYVCLLRGINVSGKNLVKMESLREAFSRRGYTKVETYVQSGNVVFDTKKTSRQARRRDRKDHARRPRLRRAGARARR